MSDNGIVWEEPPPKPARNGRTGAGKHLPRPWIEPLMAEPTRWARIETWPDVQSATNRARDLRHYSPRLRRLGRWEFKSRTVPNGRRDQHYVYARYLGPEEEAS